MTPGKTNYWLAFGIALIHIPPLSLFWIGGGDRELIAFVLSYLTTVFVVFAGLHRYFSHRAFQTSRAMQFLMALLASMLFGDAIGFAGRHRIHHRHSDTDEDLHSPQLGFWHCWIGHVLKYSYSEGEILDSARDLTSFPELLWLHNHWLFPGIAAGALILMAFGYRAFAAGFCMAPLLALHGTSAVNFFCHRGGTRRFETPDRSSNSWSLAILLLGEGWHNNHHAYPGSAMVGMRWYEIDVIYWALKLAERARLIWGVREILSQSSSSAPPTSGVPARLGLHSPGSSIREAASQSGFLRGKSDGLR